MTSGIFRVLVCFVRQWLHDHVSFTEAEDFTRFQREGGLGSFPYVSWCRLMSTGAGFEYKSWILWEMTSRMFPFSVFTWFDSGPATSARGAGRVPGRGRSCARSPQCCSWTSPSLGTSTRCALWWRAVASSMATVVRT